MKVKVGDKVRRVKGVEAVGCPQRGQIYTVSAVSRGDPSFIRLKEISCVGVIPYPWSLDNFISVHDDSFVELWS